MHDVYYMHVHVSTYTAHTISNCIYMYTLMHVYIHAVCAYMFEKSYSVYTCTSYMYIIYPWFYTVLSCICMMI